MPVEEAEMSSEPGEARRYWGVVTSLPAPVIAMLAQQAEAQGLDGVFAPQVLGPPWVPLAVAAAHTQRIRIASGIAIAAARSLFETAMAAIDMDRISEPASDCFIRHGDLSRRVPLLRGSIYPRCSR
jgi:hypothetical protein